ncbi:hypothetical protein F5Y06DRAFT_76672 [Hypoxylon sp. FL0890]|nr:hypothetical protein F5Y06DRAFT_76672 [Hypoxylon sp. FL0890]
MTSTRSHLTALGHHEAQEPKFVRIGRVPSRGFMIGAAIFFPATLHLDNAFYRYLVLCTFSISTIIHIACNWEAVRRYFFLALVTIAMPSVVTLPFSEGSVPLLLGRLPILIMLMGLFIEEYSRRFMPNSRNWERAPDPRLSPSAADYKAGGEYILLPPGLHDELVVHMYGGERDQYRAPSQVSSEISLSTVGSGRLPSSCDTMTRAFWCNELVEDHKHRGEHEDRGSQTD